MDDLLLYIQSIDLIATYDTNQRPRPIFLVRNKSAFKKLASVTEMGLQYSLFPMAVVIKSCYRNCMYLSGVWLPEPT
jgi:hypothetical protein